MKFGAVTITDTVPLAIPFFFLTPFSFLFAEDSKEGILIPFHARHVCTICYLRAQHMTQAPQRNIAQRPIERRGYKVLSENYKHGC